MNKYKKGDVLQATVKDIEKYGIFVSIDEEYSGLIHISEITERFVNDIHDFVEVEDEITVKILDIPANHNQLKLSSKDLNANFQKRKKRKIKETVFGFYLLKTSLPKWIDKKMEEINKKL